ncbi:fatty acyl-CoA reductase 1 isoform X2 [Cryptotermes secundus]|uniref:fatty acyl-CoA reductase 1 isoform X2 n=1 Tax=Cryptotermes secundus TaxID=105785 RepID=UPI000CD7DBB2|nr:fatty acyl-CoA reductase 1 isoform X2 [Cryptotermes secundus]
MTSIPEFFKNQSVLVTGGTGFLGKALLEKLLRSCPDVGIIYVLMRKKKGKELTQRVRDITDMPLFDVLKRANPENLKKIVPLLGDCKQLGLGLSPTDRQLIKEKVSIVFHCAATIRFDDTLKNSIILNVRSTREVMILARNMKELKVVVHVSTIFSNCNRKVTDEVFYPTTIDWKEMIDVVENIDDSTIDILTPKIIGTFPNTYVYSKSLAEKVVKDLGVNLPTVIVRPSMVFTSLSDPFPGWADSWGGPVAISVGVAKGIIRNCNADRNAVMDIIPVDTVTKIICSAAHEKALCGDRMEPSVYNACSYSLKKLTWGSYTEICLKILEENPLDDILWIPGITFIKNDLLFWLMSILFQVLPSAVLHGILKLKGTKSPLLYFQRKGYIGALGVKYFNGQSWEFKNKNVQELRKNLLPADRKEFDLDDFESVNFKQYFSDAYKGIRLYLMKQPACTTPDGWTHFRRFSPLLQWLQM